MSRPWIFAAALTLLASAAQDARAAEEGPLPRDPYRYEVRRLSGRMETPRSRHVAFPIGGGRIGVFAGFGRMDAAALDVAKETFSVLPFRQDFPDLSGAPLQGGAVLLVDGRNDAVFDPAAGALARLPATYTGRHARWAAAVPLPDGRVFLCGGSDGSFKALDDCAIFDPKTRRLAAAGRMAVPRVGHSAHLVSNDRIVIAGGDTGGGERAVHDTIEAFDLKTGKSEILGARLAARRTNHGAALLRDGTLLFAGGTDFHAPSSNLKSAETFDPRAETVEEAGPLAVGRWTPIVLPLPSGRAAVIGGYDDVRVIEIYRPGERDFIPAATLLADPRRAEFSATPLPDGRIVVIGGRANSTAEVLATAEFLAEVKDATAPAEEKIPEEIARLFRDLGDDAYAVREAATQALIGKGPAILLWVRRLRAHEDPEVRDRAETILRALSPAGGRAPWAAEVLHGDAQAETLQFGSYARPDHKSDDPRVAAILKAAAGRADARLVVRFPEGTSPREQAHLLDLAGWSRIERIILGPPLP